MTDTTTAAGAPAAAESPKRIAIAQHDFIATDDAGAIKLVDDIQTATGIRYTDKASGKVFDYAIPGATAGTTLTMLAVFGAKTKATNETSRVRQNNGKVNNGEMELEALDEVFESITKGVWREQAEGGSGSRTDKPLLATVLVEMLGESAKGDVAYYVARFESDSKYMQAVLKSEAGDEYRKRAGKQRPAVSTLA